VSHICNPCQTEAEITWFVVQSQWGQIDPISKIPNPNTNQRVTAWDPDPHLNMGTPLGSVAGLNHLNDP
jgi:hypothetical protein